MMTTLLVLVVALVCALMFVVAITTLMWMLEAWRTPASLDVTRFDEPLPECDGDVVGVFDAEDLVAPGLLERVEQVFVARPDVDVVQGGVQLMNFRSSWWALRNCLEYYFYFHSRLHLHARKGFIPLGGN